MSARHLAELFASRQALVIGEPCTPLERGLLAHLRASAPELEQVTGGASAMLRARRRAEDRLAVVFDPALVSPALVSALAEHGCRGVLWPSAADIPLAVLAAARPSGLRFVGPRSAGFLHAGGLHAAAFGSRAGPGGGLALIAQSGSIAAAAVDWAAGRDIGFAWAVATGGEGDADVADFLDAAALDPRTRAVVLQVGRIGAGRKFMSAARACARLKPVVVLQSRVGAEAESMGGDPVRSAAFARAGLVECETLDGLFDALSAMARLPDRPQMRVLTLGNGAGMCALGVDAVRRHGLSPTACSVATAEALRRAVPRVRVLGGSLDAGSVDPASLAGLCRLLAADQAFDYLLLVFSPSSEAPPEHYVEALDGAMPDGRLLTVWLGIESALAARRRSAAAGLATFVTAGQAARALRYRWLYGRMRELLMQTPPARPADEFDAAAVHAELAAALQSGRAGGDAALAHRVLDGYHLPLVTEGPSQGLCFELQLRRHPEFGLYLSLMAHAAGLYSARGWALPPLDVLLAQRAVESLGLELAPAMREALQAALLNLSQLALDQPQVEALELELAVRADGGLYRLPEAHLELTPQPPPDTQRLALAPYPAALTRTVTLKGNGRRYRLRPVLPEDEPALLALLDGMRPDDIRLRFFSTIRYFSHEMAARMTQIDYDREMVLVAEPLEPATGPLCAVGHLAPEPYGGAAEFGVMVHHDHARGGLGRELLQALLDYAHDTGLSCVYGDVLRDNAGMLALARRMGFACRRHPQDAELWRVEIGV